MLVLKSSIEGQLPAHRKPVLQGKVTHRPFAHCAKEAPTHAFSPDLQGEFAESFANLALENGTLISIRVAGNWCIGAIL